MGLLDLMALQDKLPGLLLYSVALGGYNGDTLLQRGSVQSVLSLATAQPYNLNFTLDPVDNHRVRAPPQLPALLHVFFCLITLQSLALVFACLLHMRAMCLWV